MNNKYFLFFIFFSIQISASENKLETNSDLNNSIKENEYTEEKEKAIYNIDPVIDSDFSKGDYLVKARKRNNQILAEKLEKENSINKFLKQNYNIANNYHSKPDVNNKHLPNQSTLEDYKSIAFIAVDDGNINLFQSLTKYIDYNIIDKEGDNLLIRAVKSNQVDMLRYLIKQKPDLLKANKNIILEIAKINQYQEIYDIVKSN